MKNKLVALRYVKAVLENISSDQKKSVMEDIASLNGLFTEEVLAKIDSKLLSIKQKKEFTSVIADNLENRDLWNNFFDLLVEKNRLSVINDILTEMDKSILANEKIERVILKLASEQNPEVVKSIKLKIEKILEHEVILKIEIDPEIIGGFEAISESKVIDASIKNSLNRFISEK